MVPFSGMSRKRVVIRTMLHILQQCWMRKVPILLEESGMQKWCQKLKNNETVEVDFRTGDIVAVIWICLTGSARSIKTNSGDPIKPLDCHIADIFGAKVCISNQFISDLTDFHRGRVGDTLCYCC